MKTPRSLAVAAMLAAAALALSACSATDASTPKSSSATIPTASADAKLKAMLPAALRDKNELIVATNAPFPPYEQFAAPGSQKLVGLEIDLGTAIGQKLGVPWKFEQQPFDGLIPGLVAGKYNVVMATLFATKERAQSMGFVTYARSGAAVMVRAGTADIKTVKDLCGRKVAVQGGSTQVDFLMTMNKTCSKPVEIQQFPQFSDELLALTSNKVDAVFHDRPPLVDAANSNKSFKVLDDPNAPGGYDSRLIGIGVPVDDAQFQQAILAAVKQLQADGIYDKIFAKWRLSDSCVQTPALDQWNK